MREVVWAVIGLLSGWRAFFLAQKDVLRLRTTGETFGAGQSTHRDSLSIVIAISSSALWWQTARVYTGDFTVLSIGLLIAVGLRLVLIDIDTHLLPSNIVFRACALTFPLLVIATVVDDTGSLAGMCFGAVALWCCMKVLAFLSRGDLGGGDVTLSLLLGMYLGWMSWERMFTAVVTAFAAAGVFALVLLAMGRAGRRTHFAFGPLLIAGTLFAVLR